MNTIKKAVLALAETHPELATELAKETKQETTARVDVSEVHRALKQLSEDKETLRIVLEDLQTEDKRQFRETIKCIMWLTDYYDDAKQKKEDRTRRRMDVEDREERDFRRSRR